MRQSFEGILPALLCPRSDGLCNPCAGFRVYHECVQMVLDDVFSYDGLPYRFWDAADLSRLSLFPI